jgi:hypothetical protein
MRRTASDLDVATSDSVWSDEALEALEREHAEGLSTQQVVELFAFRGTALSEATFRKYVQLGLLPRSVRVGRKGKHRGSQGLYPPTVVRQIESIRRLMGQGYTISEIQQEFFFLGSEIDGLARQLAQVLVGVERVVERRGAVERADDVITRAVAEARALADELITRLRAIERGLAMRARMARAAV